MDLWWRDEMVERGEGWDGKRGDLKRVGLIVGRSRDREE